MAFIEQGQQGAFKQTWRKGNPRSLLQTMMEKNPDADREKIHRLMWEEIEDDKELLKACFSYWFDNNYQSIIIHSPALAPAQRQQRERARRVAGASAELKKRIHYETRMALLQMIMPNEKPLADCTGAECGKFGGWLALVAQKVHANKTVGETLSEDQLHVLLKSKIKPAK